MNIPSHQRHEIRTPLNHIIGYSEMLIEEWSDLGAPPQLMSDLQKINDGGKALLKVANELFATQPEGHQAMQEALHNLRTPVNYIIGYCELVTEHATAHGIQELDDLAKIEDSARRFLQLMLSAIGLEGVDAPTEGDAAKAALAAETMELMKGLYAPRILGSKSEQKFSGRILVADDDAFNRDLMSRMLERLGYTVVCAENGLDVEPQLRGGAFDLLLLDIILPGMNGFQVLEMLQADAVFRHLPVIVLSALDEMDSVLTCLEMGARDYLLKPPDPVLLRTRINTSIERKRLHDREALHLQQIESEKRRADELLHVILPPHAAEELKRCNSVEPRRHENVAILFCDIVGFTAFCDKHRPEEVLPHLQSLVETYEVISDFHRLEKIKTVGDCFMAAGGLLVPLENPSLNAVRCGLHMVKAVRRLSVPWQVRIGIHAGPVLAGVVGRKKYLYDVWGDSVNTASRVESRALPGTVCVSSPVWDQIAHACQGESAGVFDMKGKGELEIFRVDRVLR